MPRDVCLGVQEESGDLTRLYTGHSGSTEQTEEAEIERNKSIVMVGKLQVEGKQHSYGQ